MATRNERSRGALLRLRPDLEFGRQGPDARGRWVVKDPVMLRYYTFRDEEHAILQWLDGRSTLAQICERFEKRFAPRRMTPQRVSAFLGDLHRQGLLISAGENQAAQLLERRQEELREDRWRRWSSLLAVRFRGFDPELLLGWLHSKARWLFTWPFLAACTIIVLSAAALLLVEANDLGRQLPSLHEFLHPGNLVWLAAVLATTKILHEVAHALTCKHFGGECHELGVMLLVFTPCLYCNVTDSWMMSSRWRRIAVSAAGVALELVLAAVATFGWWYSEPGVFHTICLNTMVVCGLGTVLLNGNPLLRYDGYFILSDLVDIPNLWQESRDAIKRRLASWLLGVDPATPLWSPERTLFKLLYGVSSMIYRALVVATIAVFLFRILSGWGLGVVRSVGGRARRGGHSANCSLSVAPGSSSPRVGRSQHASRPV